MNPRFRRVAVFVGAAALATGVGVGVAAHGGDTSSSQAAVTRDSGAPMGARGDMLSALADELGVSESKLRAAMESVRSSATPQPGNEDGMAAALAKELGLSTDKVEAALEAVRPQGAAGGMPPGAGGAPPAGAAPPDGATPPDGSSAPDGSTAPGTGGSSTGTTTT